jgi:diguanylate cyclase (GGDEF)-like protein
VFSLRATALASRDVATGEVRFRSRSGGYRWMAARETAVMDPVGTSVGFVVGLRDVHEERKAHRELAFLAFHDELTGLRNRHWLLDILDTDLAVANRDGSRLAVLFLDLDNFKVVNDSLGHVAGDDILVAAAHRISQALRPGDRIGRFGGDEFIVIAPGIHDDLEVDAIAARLTGAVTEEVHVDGRPVIVSASIGIALSTPDSTSTSLLRDADSALFRAKAAGRSRWEFFDPAMHTRAMARLVTEAELRTAITERQFVVHYQPIVALADATVVGYEALVRWNHPHRGLVPPMEFLPVAEESGLIVEIGDQVLDRVCDLITSRPDITVPISVNESPVQIGRPGWHDKFLSRIHAQNIDPRRLVIEVTETAILSVLDRTTVDLADLRDQGVGIHVDDFGTGYSSIALLRDLPVTGLKLDLSFTRHLVTDATARTLAAGLAGLAAGLNLDGIAEGIETSEQVEILRKQGWIYGQGYLYGRPAPIRPAYDVT